MAKSKIKRYDGEEESLVSGMDYGGSSGSGEYAPEPEKPQTFKEAFAAARRSGEKTFSFGGKKFTTELASEKKTSTSMKSTAEPAKTEAKSESSPRFGRAGQATARKEPVMTQEGMDTANAKRAAARESLGDTGISRMFKAIRSRGEAGAPTYAKGGSVSSASKRADGIAQRGKTKGTMVMCGGGYMKGKK